MIKKRNLILVIILTIIAIIVYIFKPIPFNKEFFNADRISVSYFVDSMKDGTMTPEFKTFTFDDNSTKFHQLENIIEKYSYHKCFKSWINNGTLSGPSYIMSTNERTMIIAESSYIDIDSCIYRIDYWGNSKTKKLVTELKNIWEN